MDRESLNRLRERIGNDEEYATLLRMKRALLREKKQFAIWVEFGMLEKNGTRAMNEIVNTHGKITPHMRQHISDWQRAMRLADHPFQDHDIEKSEWELLSWQSKTLG